MKLDFSRQILAKYSDIKFHKKSFHSELSYSGRTDGQTDMTNLIAAFQNFAKARKSWPDKFLNSNNVFFILT